MKAYRILALVYYTLFLASGTQLSKRINQSLTIQCQCEDTSICNWYHNDQSVPSQWVQDNGGLLLPANDWNVYGVIINQCGSDFYTNNITNPGMCICNVSYLCCYSYVYAWLSVCLSVCLFVCMSIYLST